MTSINLILLACLFFSLVIETIRDVRNHEIPVFFSLVMLIPGIVALGFYVSPWASLLIAISVASTEALRRSKVLGVLGIFAPLPILPVLFHELTPLATFWGLLALAWALQVIGGADALAGLTLLLFFPSTWAMPTAIAAGIIAWGGGILLLRYGKDTGLRLLSVLQARSKGTKAAGLGAYALAVLFFGAFKWFLR